MAISRRGVGTKTIDGTVVFLRRLVGFRSSSFIKGPALIGITESSVSRGDGSLLQEKAGPLGLGGRPVKDRAGGLDLRVYATRALN